MEAYSSGNYRKKYVPPMSKAELKRKRKRLNEASKKLKNHHENIDLPKAEEFLKKSLSSEKKIEKKSVINTQKTKTTFLSTIKNYIYGFFKR